MIAYRDGQPTPGLLRLQQAERSIAEKVFAFQVAVRGRWEFIGCHVFI